MPTGNSPKDRPCSLKNLPAKYETQNMSGNISQTQVLWRPVVGFEGFYEVSDDGRIRSVDRYVVQENRSGPAAQFIRGRELKNAISRGYTVVNLWRDGRGTKRGVHRVMLEAFVGPCPAGMQACHNDGVRFRNVISNLRYGTPLENGQDKVLHGTSRAGSRSHLSKLDERKVRLLRRLASKFSRPALASMFGVTPTNVGYILRGETWRNA